MKRFTHIANQGFTVIEVMIVLAIAGLIMLIIFLTVPTAQAHSRNLGRKSYVDLLATDMEEYKNNHGLKYPETGDEVCDFLKNYAATRGNPATSPCDPGWTGPGSSIQIQTRLYTISYHANFVPHDYTGDLDELNIALSHWCNTDPTKFGEGPDHIITNGNVWPFDNLFSRYVIWTPLERSSHGYCIDSYPRDN